MIPIRNVYYMLSYAFEVLNSRGYKSLAAEEFANAADLCAGILVKGVAAQVKRGLGREYLVQAEETSSLRGRIALAESIEKLTMVNKRMVCEFDEFSTNSYLNRVVKSTILLLLRADVAKPRKKELRKALVFFGDVDEIDLFSVDWHMRFDRNNRTYRLLVGVCYLVVKGLLQTQSDGRVTLEEFFDEQRMCRLYEKFLLEYYKKEFPTISASASQIPWRLDDGVGDMLPVMQTDLTLAYRDRVLIVDAKYYAQTTQTHFGVHSLHSGNLYQIFTYVKNKAYGSQDRVVSGLLLYAKTDEDVLPDNTYQMSGNTIGVGTLDLNCDFAAIRARLDSIAVEYLGIRRG